MVTLFQTINYPPNILRLHRSCTTFHMQPITFQGGCIGGELSCAKRLLTPKVKRFSWNVTKRFSWNVAKRFLLNVVKRLLWNVVKRLLWNVIKLFLQPLCRRQFTLYATHMKLPLKVAVTATSLRTTIYPLCNSNETSRKLKLPTDLQDNCFTTFDL